MIATLEPRSPLDQWRQRFGDRCRRSQPRPLAAMGYLTYGPVIDGLIDVEDLTIVFPSVRAIDTSKWQLSGASSPWRLRSRKSLCP